MFDWWMYRPAFKERHQGELAEHKNELFDYYDEHDEEETED